MVIEIQCRPDLFPLLRVLADRADIPARFLILGSASPELMRHASESLAGRIVFHEMDGFGLDELAPDRLDLRWLRGGLPRAYLAKVYVSDTGILHRLLGIGSEDSLLAHPKCGASWEGFALHEILRRTGTKHDQAFYWGVHTGAELDLLINRDGQRFGFEIKLTRSPGITPSMRSAMDVLALDHLYLVCSGEEKPWPLSERITALPLGSLWETTTNQT